MTDYMTGWILLMGVMMVALASPGPDFVMAVRSSILYSRRIGIWTSVGFALGVAVHVTYTLMGLAAVISHSVFAFSLIKYAGAAYLIYIGIKSLHSSGFSQGETLGEGYAAPTFSAMTALRMGFLTNLLNPKAAVFFLAIFSQFVHETTPTWVQVIYAVSCVLLTLIWFSGVAVILTQAPVRAAFLSVSKWIDRICGGALIALGLKLAFTRTASVVS